MESRENLYCKMFRVQTSAENIFLAGSKNHPDIDVHKMRKQKIKHTCLNPQLQPPAAKDLILAKRPSQPNINITQLLQQN